jgi:hypothetical protein
VPSANCTADWLQHYALSQYCEDNKADNQELKIAFAANGNSEPIKQ